MQLGINLGYWGAGMDGDNLAVAQEADRLGYAVCWAAEAYGSDAATVLTWVAAQTERIDVGSAIFQIPARQPTMTAMTAATLDSLSGGRFRLGLGVSGPQVSEGWYGVKFDKPLARTREYVEIVRKAMTRERLSYETADLQLPVGKSVRGKCPVALIVDLGRAVRLEVLRNLGLAIFAGERRWRDERPLARIGKRLRLVENALDPRLLGKLAVATAGERRAGDSETAREEAAPVELWLHAHA